MPRTLIPAALLIAGVAASGSAVLLGDSPMAQRRPTFAADIAPLMLDRCASCHRPGQPALFPLLSYDDVKAKAPEIVAATRARTMPPWLATQGPGFPALQDDARLTDKQIDAIAAWVKNGMPRGDAKKTPAPPIYPMTWPLGTPDLAVEVPRNIAIQAGASSEQRNVVIPINFPTDLWINAIDYQRADAGLVQHAHLFLAPPDLTITDDDALPGVGGLLGNGSLENYSDRLFAAARGLIDLGAWTPTMTRRIMPDNLAVKVPPRWNVVVQMHLQQGSADAAETGRIGIYYAKPPLRREIKAIDVPPALGIASGLSIPAGESRHILRDAFVLPVAVEAVGARAYAHSLGRDLTLRAQLPDGNLRGLLYIDRWNPEWPDTYYFVTPIKLPKGAAIQVEIGYDNSADNPRNIFSPPRRVGWGRIGVGEVGGMTLLIASPSPDDAKALDEAKMQHLREQLLGK